jgi:ABC-type hemin transport system substrate-binding protein
MKVVTLVPSVTETLLAWGITPVACTRFCEQPSLVHVGGTKNPDVAAIVALAPDLVVVNDEENRREDADALAVAGIAVHSCSPRSVDDVPAALADLAVTPNRRHRCSVGRCRSCHRSDCGRSCRSGGGRG